ncbi:MAG: glycosyl hydrolase, partial [Bacteroidota bacterium]
VLYAYSPNTFDSREEYLTYYPGDTFVDVLGVDIYQHWTTTNFIKNLNENIPILREIANEKNKPYALTEAGLNKIRVTDWWTQVMDKHIANSGIAWALFWRNARKSHHFAPYPDHISSADFKKLKALPHVLFLEDIKGVK